MKTIALSAALCCSLLAGGAAVRADTGDGMLRWNAAGVQIYVCRITEGAPAWRLHRPEATLRDDRGHIVGRHGAGPIWTSLDGSIVRGEIVASIPSPDSGSVAWLVLRAIGHEGPGTMSPVAYILRTDTEGGAAPTAGCDARHEGQETRAPYKAVYTFLAAPPAAP